MIVDILSAVIKIVVVTADISLRVNAIVYQLTNFLICSSAVKISVLCTYSLYYCRVVGVGALLTTSVACVLIFTQMVMDGLRRTTPVSHKPHSINDFFLSFGTILFAYGGAATFPTIQNDMVHRDKFSVSASIGFCGRSFIRNYAIYWCWWHLELYLEYSPPLNWNFMHGERTSKPFKFLLIVPV